MIIAWRKLQMSWSIFIQFYLWHNSLKRWVEQPLSLLSKLVVAALLGLLGALVVLGLKELGTQLDMRLRDREILLVIISESVPKEQAIAEIEGFETSEKYWNHLGNEVSTLFQTAAAAEMQTGKRIPVVAVQKPESHGMVDDFYLLTQGAFENTIMPFKLQNQRSEAWARPITGDMDILFRGRDVLVGSVDRLSGVLIGGFTRTTILRAGSVNDVQKIHDIVDAANRIEDKRMHVQSNLRILRELEKVKALQSRSLLLVSFLSSLVLGLVFGSLAWMEFREARYLLALIRSFGVGSVTLLVHAILENCMLAVGGVLLGFGVLELFVSQVNLVALKLTWLNSPDSFYTKEGCLLVLGAAFGGLLSCIPIAIGLRKPLGLVIK
jgi:hypothetical protein